MFPDYLSSYHNPLESIMKKSLQTENKYCKKLDIDLVCSTKKSFCNYIVAGISK